MVEYYPDGQKLCHRAKEGDAEAIRQIADYLCAYADPMYRLVPIPNHTGEAEYTLEIAMHIASRTGMPVCNILECEPHEPIYDMKKAGRKPEVEFYLVAPVPEGRIYLVDAVIATGYTMRACRDVLGGRGTPLAYAFDHTKNPFWRRAL